MTTTLPLPLALGLNGFQRSWRLLALVGAALTLASCGTGPAPAAESPPFEGETAEAVFAGGCFWCVESDFEKLDGVIEAVSGYTGGRTENPTSEEVSREDTGHYEAVRVIYDPSQVSYEDLVAYFFRHVDPTDADGQFCDRGESYRTAVFASPEQAATARAEIAAIEAAGVLPGPVVTPVLPLAPFYLAEDYHQDYSDKNPVRYRLYRTGCGRDARVAEVWAGERRSR